jgi:hypothetical protein
MQQTTPVLNLRVGGRIAAEITRIAIREQNSVSAVARRLIAAALQLSSDNQALIDRVGPR